MSTNSLDEAIADPHPYVLNLTSLITWLLLRGSHLICNLITSPQAGAPTIPVPISESLGFHLPTLFFSGSLRVFSNFSTTFLL